jgi:5'-3' exonuclease
MISLIDADSIIWIVGYNNRDHTDIQIAEAAADDFVRTILLMTHADKYLGTFSSEQNFRHRTYRYAKYKGERPERPEWFKFWEKPIKDYLIREWNFIVPEDLEADDIMAAIAELCDECIICSPDKDMRQIPGYHYDYKKTEMVPVRIEDEEAKYNLWLQILTGDGTDNIAGLPGIGPVKAEKILKGIDNVFLYSTTVVNEYIKYFGAYYGPIIAAETRLAIQLMCKKHPLYPQYKDQIEHTRKCVYTIPARKEKSGFASIQE